MATLVWLTFSGWVPSTTWASKQPCGYWSPWWQLPWLWTSEPSGSSVIQGSAWCHNEHVQQPLGGQPERCLEVHRHVTQEIDGEALVTDGRSWRGCGLSNPFMTPTVSICGQHLTTEGVNMVELVDRRPWGVDLPSGSCPKRYWRWRSGNSSCRASTTFWKHTPTCQSFTTNISSLAKITNPEIFWHGHEGSGKTDDSGQRPRVLPESGPRSTPKDHSRRMPCPGWKKSSSPRPASLAQEPWYGPTRLLAAVVWLPSQTQVFQMAGTTKEACTTFEVRAKQLSKLLLGKVYLGGSAGAAKGKRKWSHTMAHEGDVTGDEPPSPSPPPRSETPSSPGSSSTGGAKMGFIYDYIWVTTHNRLPPP